MMERKTGRERGNQSDDSAAERKPSKKPCGCEAHDDEAEGEKKKAERRGPRVNLGYMSFVLREHEKDRK